jgi:alanyl-tRNA synthetase
MATSTSMTSAASLSQRAKVVESEAGWVAIDPCPFHAAGGGQAGDRGVLVVDGTDDTITVSDTLRINATTIGLRLENDVTLPIEAVVIARVDLAYALLCFYFLILFSPSLPIYYHYGD